MVLVVLLHKRLTGLGPVTDVDGVTWDIHGIIGKYVQAAKESLMHPFYTDTSSNDYGGQLISQRWEPYLIEIVDEPK